ncbi:MAG: hypothetical protein CVT64_11440 [Actinobacteria bacterium HGW-Actinobacteria-4]|nr:MAG: hypothetical protein CVT64_11440 [Actinobacteria bacterium HGW-Actinobacteria-4]
MRIRRESPLRELANRPGSLNQLKRLGDAIRDDNAQAYRGVHYDDVFSWYNDLVVAVIEDIDGASLKSLLADPDSLTITGRAKTRNTVREKLRRRHADKLPSIQDLAGVRIEADMTLSEQDAVAKTLCDWFGQGADAVHDLRDGEHAGYRAVHVWVRLDQPKGAWFEIQVRTLLQSEWANYFEALADYLGRDLRYGFIPVREDLAEQVRATQEVSRDMITKFEQLRDQTQNLRLDEGRGRTDHPIVSADTLDPLRAAMRGVTDQLRSMIQEGGPQNVELRRDL